MTVGLLNATSLVLSNDPRAQAVCAVNAGKASELSMASILSSSREGRGIVGSDAIIAEGHKHGCLVKPAKSRHWSTGLRDRIKFPASLKQLPSKRALELESPRREVHFDHVREGSLNWAKLCWLYRYCTTAPCSRIIVTERWSHGQVQQVSSLPRLSHNWWDVVAGTIIGKQ